MNLTKKQIKLRLEKNIKSHSVLRKEFKIVWDRPSPDAIGRCTNPDLKHKTINIHSRLEQFELLRVTLHELLHASAFHVFDEDFVDDLSTDMARLLTRMGIEFNFNKLKP